MRRHTEIFRRQICGHDVALIEREDGYEITVENALVTVQHTLPDEASALRYLGKLLPGEEVHNALVDLYYPEHLPRGDPIEDEIIDWLEERAPEPLVEIRKAEAVMPQIKLQMFRDKVEWLKDNGVPNYAVATAAQISTASLSAILSGTRNATDIERLIEVADVMIDAKKRIL